MIRVLYRKGYKNQEEGFYNSYDEFIKELKENLDKNTVTIYVIEEL